MVEILLSYKIIGALCVVVTLLFLENRFPALSRGRLWPGGSELVTTRYKSNVGLWLINSLLSPLVTVPVTLWFASVALLWRAGADSLLVDLLLLDFWIYWWHRANHRIPVLWRFHQVHHLDQWLDVTTSFRFHFGEVLLSTLFRGIFIWLMGVSWQAVLVFEALTLVCASFHHSNLQLPLKLEKGLSWLIVTPSIHWVHHHILRKDTDSDYGVVLSCWDRLFNSFSATSKSEITALGLEQSKDLPLLLLLAKPFSRVSTDQSSLR